jgi:hypothetical protein
LIANDANGSGGCGGCLKNTNVPIRVILLTKGVERKDFVMVSL